MPGMRRVVECPVRPGRYPWRGVLLLSIGHFARRGASRQRAEAREASPCSDALALKLMFSGEWRPARMSVARSGAALIPMMSKSYRPHHQAQAVL